MSQREVVILSPDETPVRVEEVARACGWRLERELLGGLYQHAGQRWLIDGAHVARYIEDARFGARSIVCDGPEALAHLAALAPELQYQRAEVLFALAQRADAPVKVRLRAMHQTAALVSPGAPDADYAAFLSRMIASSSEELLLALGALQLCEWLGWSVLHEAVEGVAQRLEDEAWRPLVHRALAATAT